MLRNLHCYCGANNLHFITYSCYRRRPELRTTEKRDRFLTILEQTRLRYRFVVVGYVVMPEHIHLLLSEPETETPSKVMQVLKQRTSRALLPKRRAKPTCLDRLRCARRSGKRVSPYAIAQQHLNTLHSKSSVSASAAAH